MPHGPLEYRFEWDEVKASANLRKHGIAFERATSVFADLRALSVPDERHGADEERWVTLGLDRNGILVVVCHSYREEAERTAAIRIISVRKATAKESRQYGRL